MTKNKAVRIRGTDVEMPDLSGLYDKNILNFMLDRAFGGDPGPQSHPEQAMWANLVRLSDKALREYEFARKQFAEFRERAHMSHFSPFVRGIDHLENTITATHRAILHGRALRAKGWGRRATPPTARQENLLRVMRNHIEHADDKLLKGQIKSGENFTLTPEDKRARIGSAVLTYRDLSSCVRKVYSQVEAIRGPSK